jgi:hypothetical protein
VARKRKPSGRLTHGPFTAADVRAALKRAGGLKTSGGGHQEVYDHPDHGWKVPISDSWTGLKKGCPILKGIARTLKVTDDQLLRLLNGLDP